jgi:hypothetical protein
VLDAYCIKPDTPENVRFQYLYFVAKVVSRSPIVHGYDPSFFYYVLKEILTQHKRYLEFVKKLYDMHATKQLLKEELDPMTRLTLPKELRKREMDRCNRKVQRDLIRLIQKSEPLDNFKTSEIIRLTELTTL